MSRSCGESTCLLFKVSKNNDRFIEAFVRIPFKKITLIQPKTVGFVRSTKLITAILIHGNGGCKPTDNWFPYLKRELEKVGIKTEAPQFPDADLARASYWIPFLKDVLKADDKTIIVGHSSGAIAAMRFAEKNQILGSVLVGAYHTDLGIENEKLSGYFDTLWDWNAIKKNQKWIVQFAGVNDPWIPIDEARYIHAKLNTDYHESMDQGHFGGDYYKETFPEAFEAIKAMIKIFPNVT
ncbi:MAG: alpha/beta hydrolase [Parachlamydiaceae bacterium]|nr:alpha/beta hydrolase [Parachlamydiaceae bacterium]